jgi:hypothetical protein
MKTYAELTAPTDSILTKKITAFLAALDVLNANQATLVLNVKMIGTYTIKNVSRLALLVTLENVKKEFVKNVMMLVRSVLIVLPLTVNTVLKVSTLMEAVVLKLKIVEKELMPKILLENVLLAQFHSVLLA